MTMCVGLIYYVPITVDGRELVGGRTMETSRVDVNNYGKTQGAIHTNRGGGNYHDKPCSPGDRYCKPCNPENPNC